MMFPSRRGIVREQDVPFFIRRQVRALRERESCKCSRIGIENRVSSCAYLPSSAIKVDDSPIRNLACISGTRGNVRAAAVTTITTAIMFRYHYYSARYFDSHARASLLLVSFKYPHPLCVASVYVFSAASKEDASPATQWPAYYDNLIEKIVSLALWRISRTSK